MKKRNVYGLPRPRSLLNGDRVAQNIFTDLSIKLRGGLPQDPAQRKKGETKPSIIFYTHEIRGLAKSRDNVSPTPVWE